MGKLARGDLKLAPACRQATSTLRYVNTLHNTSDGTTRQDLFPASWRSIKKAGLVTGIPDASLQCVWDAVIKLSVACRLAKGFNPAGDTDLDSLAGGASSGSEQGDNSEGEDAVL